MGNLKNQNVERIYFLSPMQEGMLFHSLLNSRADAYFQQISFELLGVLDIETFRRSFELLVERYEILRTVFIYERLKRPTQVVLKKGYANIYFEDISCLDESERAVFIEKFRKKDRERGFDLSKDVPVRISVLRTGEGLHRVVWSFHHILMDGWSMGIVLKELFNTYRLLEEGISPKTERSSPYSSYIEWLERQDRKAASSYWERYLDGYAQQSSPPKAGNTDGKGDYVRGEFCFTIDEGLTRALENIARDNRSTLSTVCQTIWGILLQRYNNTDDVVFGSVVSGRTAEISDIENMVGLFINTIPIRIRCDGSMSFSALVRAVQQDVLLSQEYGSAPLYSIQAGTELKQDLIDHIIAFENYPLEKGIISMNGGTAVGLAIRDIDMFEQTSYDLDIQIIPEKGLTVKFRFNTLVYNGEFIKSAAGHFIKVAQAVTENAGIPVKDIDILTEDEKKRIIFSFNDTEAGYPKDKTIHGLFEEQVERTPDNTAVIFEGKRLTYRELNKKANQLAAVLRERGARPDSIIAIMVERSQEMIIGILGILKAGGTYLPIDPDYPEDRIQYMLQDSGAGILLTKNAVDSEKPITVIKLDESIYTGDGLDLAPVNKPSDLAYIIYTSGTTGKPKGAMIEHRNVVRLLFNDRMQFDFNQNDVWTMFHSYCFDFSVWEMYGALLYGGTLVVVPRLTAKDAGEYLKLLKRERVTVLNQTPTAFYTLAEEELRSPEKELAVRYVIFGGEALKPVKLKMWKAKYPDIKLINMYGITETTVHVTYKEITEYEIESGISNIGKPIPTLMTYVVDKYLRLTPIGVAGELCVGGDGVGRGYLNRPELTAEKFIQNLFIKGQLMYRSGDLVRLLPNGELEYLGRIDHQVKIRGHRIELGEVESLLLKYEAIKEAVVIAKEDGEGNKYLCAYIAANVELTTSELREYLSRELPEYMIPSYFIRLEKMPVTVNGKIDRKALPEPGGSINTGVEYEKPGNETEEKLAEIWAEVLGLKRIGVNDSFFNVGGDSIRAISLISRINKALGTSIQIKDLYTNQTIRKLSSCTGADSGLENNLRDGLKIIETIKQDILKDEKKVSLLPNDWEDFYPLSRIQQGMVFYSRLRSDEPIYHDQFVYRVRFKKFDIDILRKAASMLAEKHSLLRVTFSTNQFDMPLQIVHRNILPEIIAEDISGLGIEEQKRRIKGYMEKDLGNKFRFDGVLLWRLRLFQLDSENHAMVLSFQHAILDGWSVAVFNSELIKIYMALVEGEACEIQGNKSSYKDYVAINLSRKISPETREFWKRLLEGHTRTKLPFNISGKKVSNVKGSRIYRRNLNSGLLDALERMAGQYGCTLKEICLAAHIYLLGIITTEDDIVTGVVTHDRPALEDSEKVLGCFLNTAPIRMGVNAEMSKAALLGAVKKYLISAKSHELFLGDIAVIAGETATEAGNPIFDTLFNFTDFHVYKNADAQGLIGEVDGSLQIEHSEMTNTLFDLEVSKTLNKFGMQIKYSPNYFYDKDIETAANLYTRILERFADSGSRVLRSEELITQEEKRKILYEFNDTRIEYPANKTMHKLFEEQAERTPDSTALILGNMTMTYNELNEKSNQLARVLVEKGVKSGDNVVLIAQRGFEMIVGMLAILKSGAAYVPIDPEYPSARREYIAGNSGASAVVVDRNYDDLNFDNIVKIDYSGLKPYSTGNLDIKKDPRELAYIIYTSGSTGMPKGVMIEHHSAVNLITWVNREFNITSRDSLLFITSMCFDLSVYDIFGILAAGGRVVIARKEQVQDTKGLKSLLMKERITFWDSVPTTMNYLVNALEESDKEYRQQDLRLVFLSGDWIPVKLPDGIKKHFPNTRVISLGGATEGTVWSIYYPIEKVTSIQTSIPYGRPIDNNYFYILDKNMNIVPEGVAGELYIGGVGVARGYANDLDKTRASFVKNKFLEDLDKIMYKTGDLGRMLPDGNIEFLGRADHQVKIRGFRVELGEIENQLLRHQSVKEAVVVDRADAGGTKYLCAYTVSDMDLSASVLREHLLKELPDYMIPSCFIRLEKLPLTPNGKVDRKALPEPAINMNAGSEFVSPADETEERLQKIWQEVLEVERIGVEDDFFELGGHSLKATSLVSKIHKSFNVEVPLREIFRLTTIRKLSKHIKDSVKSIYSSIEPVEEMEYYPVSSAQKRMYALSRLEEEGISYNQPYAMIIEGSLDIRRMEEAFKALVKRHEAFRTSFEFIGGEPVQRVHKDVDFKIICKASEESKVKDIVGEFIRPFDLGKAPLLRIELVRLSEHKHLMLSDIHHIVSDGISIAILIREFTSLYEGRSLPELKIQYKDFSAWQNKLLESAAVKRQEEYWIKAFSGDVPRLNMPTDYPRPSVRNVEAARIHFEAGRELTECLNSIAAETGATMFMILMAAYSILLHKYTGGEDITVGTPIAGRQHTDLENVIGMFVNTLALRNYPERDKTFRNFLKEVSDNALKAYENQDYQFEKLVETLGLERELGRNPLFDNVFVLQNVDIPYIKASGLTFMPYEIGNITSKFDLVLEALEIDGEIKFSLEYCIGLFKKETAEALAGDYLKILRSIAEGIDIKIKEIELGIKHSTLKNVLTEEIEFDL